MLKTNSKKALENITKEITNEFEPNELYKIIEDFNNYNYENSSPVNSITDFIANYSCCNSWTYYSVQREILQKALEETDEEASKYSDEEVSNLFYYLFDKCILKYTGYQIKYCYIKGNPSSLRTYPKLVKIN